MPKARRVILVNSTWGDLEHGDKPTTTAEANQYDVTLHNDDLWLPEHAALAFAYEVQRNNGTRELRLA